MGHEDPSEPPTLSGRSRFGQAIFAELSGNDGNAPEPAIRRIGETSAFDGSR
jgi:hypothetical protein